MASRRRSSLTDITRVNDGVMRVNDDAFRRLSEARPDIVQQGKEAQTATDAEKNLTVKQSIRLYKKAICYSLIMSLAVVMEG